MGDLTYPEPFTLRQPGADWQSHHGHPMEVVELSQFCGTIYAASGWPMPHYA